jgi:hypothetical protein
MTSRFAYLLAVLALYLTYLTGSARADSIVFDNLGSGGSVYNSSQSSFSAAGAAANNNLLLEPAEFFVPASSYDFTELDIALSYVSGTNSATVDLLSGTPCTGCVTGDSPGAILESWNVSNLPSFSTCCTLQTLSGNGTIPLSVGVVYWVEVLPGDTTTLVQWNANTTGDVGIFEDNHGFGWGGGTSRALGALEVLGASSSTPEPGTTVLIVVGLLVLVGKLKGLPTENAAQSKSAW